MIVKEYYQNINIHKPRDYFEKWYADLWNRRIRSRIAQPGVVESLMKEELAEIGATFNSKDNDYRFVVRFNDESAYTMFVLRWA
jgi:hypothetical protein